MVAHQGRAVRLWKESITDMAVDTIGPVVDSIAAIFVATSAVSVDSWLGISRVFVSTS
jgi:hypothetical protein